MDKMDKKALGAFACEAAKSIKTESDLDDFRKMLTKVVVELDEHLGYEKNTPRNQTPIMGIPESQSSLMMVKCR